MLLYDTKYLQLKSTKSKSGNDWVYAHRPNAKDVESYILHEGDITFARTGATVGKTYIYNPLDGRVIYAGFLIKATLKDTVCPYFIFTSTLTERYTKYIQLVSQRSGQPGVNSKEYGELSLLLPPTLAEQHRIASFFRSLDTKISLQTQRIEKLKQMKTACLSRMIA